MRIESLECTVGGNVLPHTLRICSQGATSFKLLLLIEKDDPQPLELDADGETIDSFLIEWRSKHGWLEEDLWKDGELFFVIRYVKLRDGSYVVWRCDHRNKRPFDLLRLFRGTLADMKTFYARKVA